MNHPSPVNYPSPALHRDHTGMLRSCLTSLLAGTYLIGFSTHSHHREGNCGAEHEATVLPDPEPCHRKVGTGCELDPRDQLLSLRSRLWALCMAAGCISWDLLSASPLSGERSFLREPLYFIRCSSGGVRDPKFGSGTPEKE